MEIQVNGATRRLSEGTSVAELLEQLGLAGQRIAVEVNLEIVPGSQHRSTVLHAGDRVEVVRAIGGGCC